MRTKDEKILQNWIPSGDIVTRFFNYENMIAFAKHYEKQKQCDIHVVSSSLNDLTIAEKYAYLFKKVYKHITHSGTGKLLISTHYCRKAAEVLGGDYDKLSKLGKDLFKSDITDERLCVENGFDKYMTY